MADDYVEIDMDTKEIKTKMPTKFPGKRKNKKSDLEFDCYEAAQEILAEYPIKTPLKTGIPEIYNGGFYNRTDSDNRLNLIISKKYKEHVSSRTLKEIKHHILNSTLTEQPIDSEWVAAKNGLLNVYTLEFISLTPDKYVNWQVNAEYTPEADSKVIHDYVRTMVSEKDALKLQEYVGNIFANHYLTKKILFLYGGRDGGKTTFLRILEHFIGEDNCSNLTLDQLGERFVSAMMYGVRANINGEIHPTMPIKHTAKIKALTGEETITTRFLYGKPFKYHSMAKQFFAANGIPSVNETDVDDAFYSRFDFIKFPKRFTTKEKIFQKYTQPKMMSAFLNWALEGLKRLRQNGWIFTNATPIEESEYLFEHSKYGLTTFDRWLSEEYEASEEGYISEDDLWEECKKWHEVRKIIHKVYLVDKHVFGRKLSANRVIPIQKFHPLDKKSGKQVLSIKGIKKKHAGPEIEIESDIISTKDEFRKWGEVVDD